MRKRFISPFAERQSVLYHAVTRVVDRNFVLQREERDKMVEIIRKYECFCGVKVVSYCVMTNHLHLMLEVPPKVKGAAVEMSDDDFLKRMEALYSPEYFRDCELMLKGFREGVGKSDIAAEEFKAKFTRRMYDLSEFMKGVKQSFSRWFNKKHERTGTLWESRFTSVIVEDGYAARVIAAYIDLNPIRAGMVERPEDYRWSSYGEAMGPITKKGSKADRGRRLARAGICRVLQKNRETGGGVAETESMIGWEDGASEHYRVMLFSDGEEVFADTLENGIMGEGKKRVKKGFKRKDVEKVLAKGGKLSFGEALRCRVRYMNDGLVMGSRQFVDELFRLTKDQFGEKRKTGARPMREVGWQKKGGKLYTMRQLRKDVVR